MPASPDEAVHSFGFRRRDLGGTGDCAFRAFADAVAWTKSHSESDNITEAEVYFSSCLVQNPNYQQFEKPHC